MLTTATRRHATGISALALATALAAGPAQAQSITPSYNAPDPTVTSGSVTFVRGATPGVEVYTVNSPTAILDFTPNDTAIGGGAIDFQTAGTSVTYQGASDFTVLNRIVPVDPTRAVQFNGKVNSLVSSAPGGAVWFYSPGGIILGGTAQFDVGSLLLSTGDPANGGSAIASTTSFNLASKADSGYAVSVLPGAKITASPEGSYVALVAPVINQGGDVRVNGSAAYVAAETATLSINQGLFDIAVGLGSSGNGGNTLTHNGTTTGPASNGGTDNHGIYMVAVPKNSAITMIVAPNGQLGFDVAASATIENGAIYLQAGGNVSLASPTTPILNRIKDLPQSAQPASIQIGNGKYTSEIAAQATTNTIATANAAGIIFDRGGFFYGGKSARLITTAGGNLTGNGLVVVGSFGNGTPGTAQIDALNGSTMTFDGLGVHAGLFARSALPFELRTGGSAALRSTGGTITANQIQVSANGAQTVAFAGPALGGNADITTASGGSITATGSMLVSAGATAFIGNDTATGGNAVFNGDGGSIKAGGQISAEATGKGIQNNAGFGGNALITTGINGGSIEATGALNVTANGNGGNVVSGTAGAGTGGSALIRLQATAATSSIKGTSTQISANGLGGAGTSSATTTGGAGTGGSARLVSEGNGTFTSVGAIGISALGIGASGVTTGLGGTGTGGTAELTATGGQISFTSASISADGIGGLGGASLAPTTAAGVGGSGTAGKLGIRAINNGGVTGASIFASATGSGGQGGNGSGPGGIAGSGGAAVSGPIDIFVNSGGALNLTGSFVATSFASAGNTGTGIGDGSTSGGAATSSTVVLGINDGTVKVGDIQLAADAIPGFGDAAGAHGGNGIGGSVSAIIGNGSFTFNKGEFFSFTDGGLGKAGTVDNPNGGKGGNATGGPGVSMFVTAGGVVTGTSAFFENTTFAENSGIGFGGGATGLAGAAKTGLLTLDVAAGGQFKASALSFEADARGGANGGGAAIAGTARLSSNGLAEVGTLTMTASASGGSSAVAGVDGGAATGGFVDVFTGGSIATGSASFKASAIGGAYSNSASAAKGGTALAGKVFVGVPGGTMTVGGALSAFAQALGGSNSGLGDGGAAVGGRTRLSTFGIGEGGVPDPAFLTFNGTVTMNVSGTGGNAANGTGGAGYGGGFPVLGLTTDDGVIEMHTLGGTMTATKFVNLFATGQGGTGTVAGGLGRGGRVSLIGFGGDLTFQQNVTAQSNGQGGVSAKGTGGQGLGGDAFVQTINGGFGVPAGTPVKIAAANLNLTANGNGGSGPVIGGTGTNGVATIIAEAGSISFANATVRADARGGFGANSAVSTVAGGQGAAALAGGFVSIEAKAGATVTGGSVVVIAESFGGNGGVGAGTTGLAGGGGAAFATTAAIRASGGGQIKLGDVELDAAAAGGSAGTGTAQTGTAGGAATGGNSFVEANNGKIEVTGLFIRADAIGAASTAIGGNGGDATAGSAQVLALNGGSIVSGTGSFGVSAEAFGGAGRGSAAGTSGGKAVGGFANMLASSNASISVGASFADFESSGDGGGILLTGGNGTGGAGIGGQSRVNANGGTISFAGDVRANAEGGGGFGIGTGNGGIGTGGEARLGTFGGFANSKVTVLGNVSLEASAFGGSTDLGTGGDGFGGVPADSVNGPFNKGAYIVATGGAVSIGGETALDASGFGGSGNAGGGGGTGGRTNIVVFDATIDAAGLLAMDASGSGGDAGAGSAAGGFGKGGAAILSASSGGDSNGGGVVTLGAPGQITFDMVSQNVSGQGGRGGDGLSGGAGGQGGDGFGGFANAIAQAGSGTLKIGDLFALAVGQGGEGGTGGPAAASGGTGGAGGKGGAGFGGSVVAGSASGPDTAVNNGSATFGNITVFGQSVGGAGGDGSDGGIGGAGGAALGTNLIFQTRGISVEADTVSYSADALGGTGGAGSASGAGGDATAGSIQVAATNRFSNASGKFDRPERGSLSVGTFSGSAFALGGTGSTTGATTAGALAVQISKADALFDNLSLTASGDLPSANKSVISVDNGTLEVTNTLSFSVTGDAGLFVFNGGVLRADIFSLEFTGALTPPPTGGDPVTPGLIDVGTDFLANFGGDFITTTNLAVDGQISISAGGDIQIGDASAGGDITLSTLQFDPITGDFTGGDIVAGALTAGGNLLLESGDSLTTGDLKAGVAISAEAFGDLKVGNVMAGLGSDPTAFDFGDIGLDAEGSLTVGDVSGVEISLEVADFNEDGIVPVAPLIAGSLKAEEITVEGSGSVSVADITTLEVDGQTNVNPLPYAIGVAGVGDVKTGNVLGLSSFAIGSGEGSVTTGNVSVADSLLVFAATNVTMGGISTGTDADDHVFISNVSIGSSDPNFSDLVDVEEDFELDLEDSDSDFGFLATSNPVALGGALTIAGTVSTGNFAAAASTGFQSGAITAPNRLRIDSPAFITAGALTTGIDLALNTNGALATGDIKASKVNLTSKQSVSTGAITTPGAVTVNAGGIAAFSGLVSAPTISVRSSDIQIGAGLGTASTSDLVLNTGAASVLFGGTGGDTQYTITGTEAQGLRAQRITIVGEGNVTILPVSMTGSAAGSGANLVGSNGQLTIQTIGNIRVNGAFALSSAASTNRVTLRAGDRLQVATDSGGSIALTGESASALGGTLELVADNIVVANSGLLEDLAANPGLSNRGQRLAAGPSSNPRPEGFIQANRIEFQATELLAIQNSNTADLFGGFSAGSGGVAIRSSSSSSAPPLDVIINGRIQDSSGSFKVNQDTVALITLSQGEGQATKVSATSTVNGCVIGGTDCAPATPQEEPEQELIIDRIPAVISSAVAAAIASAVEPDSIAALPTVRLVATVDTAPLRTEPVIVDLVTGGGNSSLWDVAVEEEEREAPSAAARSAPEGANK